MEPKKRGRPRKVKESPVEELSISFEDHVKVVDDILTMDRAIQQELYKHKAKKAACWTVLAFIVSCFGCLLLGTLI